VQMCFSLHDSVKQCTTACCKLLQHAKNDAIFLPSIISGDETWVCGCDCETKKMSSKWKMLLSPQLTKARQIESKIRRLPINVFDMDSLMHHELLPEGHNMNWTVYRTILPCL
jgi:hypothetical protein